MGWTGNNTAFRTYIKGKDKASAEAHKGKDHVRTFEDASQFPSFGAALNDGFVDISFDTEELSNKFLDIADKHGWNCLILENIENGHIHSIWKDTKHRIIKDGRDKKLAVGLIADIHSGSTYIPLRVNGVDRFPPYFDPENTFDEVPNELLPVSTTIDLLGMEEGDGRNDTLYRYILILQNQLYLEDEAIRAVIRNINEFILKEPLSEEELSVILRDESFQKPSFFKGNTFLFDKFAAYIVNIAHVVSINNQLHIYRDGAYVTGYRAIEKIMIKSIPNLKKTQRREVIEYMELIAETLKPADARYIAFRNGIYNIVENSLTPFTPNLVITNKIDWDYNPNAYSELADTVLNRISCNDREVRLLLEECIGYCFYRRNERGKAFILTGAKSNGKSTFLDCIKTVLGADNISALELKELGDRFSSAMMFGKLANLSDDIADDFLQGSQISTFKKVVTGNRIKAERKGQDPFEFEPYVKIIASANDIPRTKDRTGAVLRRLVIIPFNASFEPLLPDGTPNPNYDSEIKYKLFEQDCIEYFIKVGIEGLQRVIKNDRFTEPQVVTEALKGYEEENNPIIGFLEQTELDEIENEPTPDVYRLYQVFCAENGMNPMGAKEFTKQVCKRLNMDVKDARVNGRKTRIYVRKD
ncbi:MAG: DNA primase [Elusimicrobia bacterium]|nr:DNA primase [Elusimicrobiota bacterium]